jgi:predicted esterase YcpF (UPF0227 family)
MSEIALVTLHGGCFTGGNSTWDLPQTLLFREIGYDVYQLEFDKSSLSTCLQDIRKQVLDIKQNYKQIIVLGRSSGGYMAKYLFEENLFDKAIYLAPIFDPYLRGSIIPKLGYKAQPFFDNSLLKPIKLDKWNSTNELLLLATEDENVPLECFSEIQLKNAIFIGPKTHKGITTCVSSAFIKTINTFINYKK